MPRNFEAFLNEVDEWIRTGRGSEARQKLRATRADKIPRPFRFRFAALARRSALPEISLLSLRTLVRPQGRKVVEATPEEKAEYAAALTDIGASPEALGLLENIDAKSAPRVLLYRAFAYFAQWNYAASISPLYEYVESSGIDENQRTVGFANLAAALVYEHDGRAKNILLRLLADADRQNYRIAQGYALQLLTEQAIYDRAWAEARVFLDRAEEIYRGTDSLELLFVEKWRVILDLYRRENPTTALESLDKIREKARKKKHWETLRNCDYHQAVRLKDEVLLLKLYFGTPYEALKKRISDHLGDVPVPPSYQWLVPCEKTGEAPPLHLLSPGNSGALKADQALYRLLVVLSSDFYRPLRVTEVHSLLYRDDFFNPLSSPGRVHQMVRRLRRWLQRRRVNLKVEQLGRYYSLRATQPLRLVVHAGKRDATLHLLQERMAKRVHFTRAEVSIALGCNRWRAQRLLILGEAKGILGREGTAVHTRYFFRR